MNLTAISADSTTLNIDKAELVNLRLVSIATDITSGSLFNPIYSQKVKPQTKMELNAVIASGITNHDIEFAPSFSNAVDDITRQAFLEQETNNYYLCFSNHTRQLLKKEYENANKTVPFNLANDANWIDLQKLYNKYYGTKQVIENGAVVPLSFSIPALYYYFGIADYIYPQGYEDRAYTPSVKPSIIGALYVALLQKLQLDISNPETHTRMAQESNEPILLTYMPFGKHKGKKIAQLLESDLDYFIWLRDETDFLKADSPKYHYDLAYTISTLLTDKQQKTA